MEMKQRKLLTKILLTFAIVFAVTFVCGTQAKAATAPGQVTGVKQTDARTGSVDIAWNAVLGSDIRYQIWMSTAQNGTYEVVDTTTYGTADSYISGLSAGKSYWVKVRAFVWDTNDNKIFGAFSVPVEVVTVPGDEISTIKHTKSTYNSIKVNWSGVSGANTYRIKYGKSGTNEQKIAYTTGTTIELKKLSKNCKYTVEIEPGRKAGTTSFVKYNENLWDNYKSYIPVRPSKTTGLDVPYYWESLGEMAVECSDNAVADGYEWECWTAYAKKNSKVKNVKSTSSYTYIKKSALRKHNFFKVRVRAYCVDSNGKKYYSPWSSWKHTCQQPDVTKIKNSKKGQTVSWDTIKGADRYVLYMSTKQKSGYKKVATTTKTKTLVTKFNKKKLKSGKKYYYYVVAYNKDGKKYYSGEAGNANTCWYKKYQK